MSARGNSSRGARANRSRSRGQGSTSRGASSSSSKSNHETPFPREPRAMRDSSNTFGRYQGKNFDPIYKKNHYSNNRTGTSSTGPNSPNPFEHERAENAAKRMQRGQNGTMVNGRGGRGSPSSRGGGNKQVRFTDQAEQKPNPFASTTSPASRNPFLPTSTTTAPSSGPANNVPFNPSAPSATTASAPNPFGAPSSQPTSGPFGKSSGSPFGTATSNSASIPSGGVFRAPSGPLAQSTSGVFGQPSGAPFGAATPTSSSSPSTGAFGAPSGSASQQNSSQFSQPPVFTFGSATSVSTSQPTPGQIAHPPVFTFGRATSGSTFQTTPGQVSQPPDFTFGSAPSAPTSKPFGAPSLGAFGANSSSSSSPASNPFAAPSAPSPIFSFTRPSSSSAFGAPSAPAPKSTTTASTPSNPFGKPTSSNAPTAAKNPFGTSHASNTNRITNGAASNPGQNGKTSKPSSFGSSRPLVQPIARNVSKGSSDALAQKIDQILRRKRLTPPPWPQLTEIRPNDPKMVKLFNEYNTYRAKVREALIEAGLMDDPEKQRKLSDALEFKGTCEDMCPEYERATRIMDVRIDPNERDGDIPSLDKMVKILARSAAGQDSPLPGDVRTAAALRRTVDYLFHGILREHPLPKVHGFLWDRTRAIRRDFVFHSYMTPPELVDQVYCLEQITRFHVIALHQMSNETLVAGNFVEQQEIEQLGKTLLSLIHTYEDCKAQRVVCDNEAEFRAYYVLLNSGDPGILELVQTWGWELAESEEIQIAIKLVEALQNLWDLYGPLNPPSRNDIAQNGFSRFFTIVEGRQVSYTMACFAEIHFNNVRKSVLKTLLGSYRKQRDQTKDWTLHKLNTYLRFDSEEEVGPFLEVHGLRIEEGDNGEEYLSFEVTEIEEPWPKPKQTHSYNIVERKRGNYSLSEVIGNTVFDESTAEVETYQAEEEVEEGLFVKDDSIPAQPLPAPVATREEVQPNPGWGAGSSSIVQQPARAEEPAKSKSLFERIGSTPVNFGNGVLTPTASAAVQTPPPKTETSSIFAKKPASEITFTTSPGSSNPFSFLQQPSSQAPSIASPETPLIQQHPAKETEPTFKQLPIGSTSSNSTTPFSFLNQNPVAPNAAYSPTPQSPGTADVRSTTTQNTTSSLFANLQSVATTAPPAMGSVAQRQNSQASVQPPFVFGTPKTSAPTPAANDSPSQNSTQATLGVAPHLFPTYYGDAAATPKPLFGANPLFGLPQPALVDRSKKFDLLADWVALGEDGIIDHFTAFNVESILLQATQMFMQEQATRAAQEADDLARSEADRFRYVSLATKYGYRWREYAHRRWRRRQVKAAREYRRELAASKAAQSANLVEDFKAVTKAPTKPRRRDSLESLLDATGVLNGVHDPQAEIQAIVRDERPKSSHKRQNSDRSSSASISSSTNGHKRTKSDNPLRRSLFSNPTYLRGDPFTSNYGLPEDGRRPVSGTHTDYFRLKARGIDTLLDGTPLARSAARKFVPKKRSFDDFQKPSTPRSSMPKVAPRSVPTKLAGAIALGNSGREDLAALKVKAKAYVSEERTSRQKRTLTNDEEEEDLFARAKRVREQMDEGTEWYRKEIERVSGSRSVS